MKIFPAIDMLEGKVVRLTQGDYETAQVYAASPEAQAEAFVAQGAEALHLVDLGGARAGRPVHEHEAVLARLREALPETLLQFGGGLREAASVTRVLEQWRLDRVVLGSLAVRAPELVGDLIQHFPDRIVLALDSREGTVATDAWRQSSGLSLFQVLEPFLDLPFAAILYTEISRDGTMSGVDARSARALQDHAGRPVLLSGGVGSLEDLHQAKEAGLAGVILGRALYEKAMTLEAALAIARECAC